MPDTYGPTSLTPLAFYDPDTSSWRTSQGTFLSASEPFSGTWPAWGTTRRGESFARPRPAHLIDVPASSSSLLPTPTADDRRNSYGTGESRAYQSLANTAVTELLPTPMASDGEKGGPNQRGGSGDLRLSSAVHLFPTPRALDSTGVRGRTPNRSEEANARAGLSLTDVTVHLLPTPSAADGMGGHMNRSGDRKDELLLPGLARAAAAGQLLPTPTSRDHKGRNQRADSTCLHGALTNPPSTDGPESWGDQLPGQLSLDDMTDPD